MTTSSQPPAEPGSDAVTPADLEAVLAGTQVVGSWIAESLASVEAEVSMPQLRVLLLAASDPHLNLTAVAQALKVHPSNATRTCDRLVGAGLLDRRTSTVDRRHLDLNLTPAGRRLVDRVMQDRRTRIGRHMEALEPADRDCLVQAMKALADAAVADGATIGGEVGIVGEAGGNTAGGVGGC